MVGALAKRAARITGKTLKFAAVAVLALIALLAVLLVFLALRPAAPNNYAETVKTGGEIEKKYLKAGGAKVKHAEEPAPEPLKKFEIYYPAELPEGGGKYPLVLFLNGTGIPGSKYKALFRHLASWGFVVAGNEEASTGTGAGADLTLQRLLELNKDPDSVFCGKLDTENIGISGHSQGGAGVLAAVTTGECRALYKTAVALSPTHEETARALGWNYELERVSAPLLMFAGTEGDFETQLVLPFEKMTEMYGKIPAPKAMARRAGAEHGDMLYSADGYVTAWLMWQLKGDAEAAKAFSGESPELLRNALYQDQQINFESGSDRP
ncbi:MAG: alpha/beta hydrolase [Oscillibacter sp.]|nr:alpha/beta hydrolase [Oscillibacter sp.]